MLTFPPELMYGLSKGGYSIDPQDLSLRTPTVSGKPRTRNYSSIQPNGVPCVFVWLDEDAEQFRLFHDADLRMGGDTFKFDVVVNGETVEQEVIFADRPRYVPHSAVGYTQVTFTLTVTERLGLPVFVDLTVDDAGSFRGILNLPAGHTLWGVNIATREGPDVGTAILSVGYGEDFGIANAYVAQLDISAVGRVAVRAGHANAGPTLGDEDAEARTVNCRIIHSGAPTTGDYCISVFWRPS